MNISISIAFLLVIVTFFLGLEIFLATRENKWIGLILPALSFFFSLLQIGGMILFVMEEQGIGIRIFFIFLLMNIPTLLLLLTYGICRMKFAKKNLIQRMNIQDLE